MEGSGTAEGTYQIEPLSPVPWTCSASCSNDATFASIQVHETDSPLSSRSGPRPSVLRKPKSPAGPKDAAWGDIRLKVRQRRSGGSAPPPRAAWAPRSAAPSRPSFCVATASCHRPKQRSPPAGTTRTSRWTSSRAWSFSTRYTRSRRRRRGTSRSAGTARRGSAARARPKSTAIRG